jgi:cell division protein FtsI (penicillin-binding protein 3)
MSRFRRQTHARATDAIQHRRAAHLAAVLLIALSVLAGRLVQLQYYEARHFEQLARRQHRAVEVLPARPGDIFDSSGRILATSVLVQSLYADPAMVQQPRELARRLAGALQLDAEELYAKLTKDRRRRFVWVERRLRDEQVEAVRALALDPAEVGFRSEYRRFYPQGRLAVQLLGFRDIDGKGQGGVEGQFDDLLRGRDGRRLLIRDAHGKTLVAAADSVQEPIAGKDLVLTLDAYIQTFAEQGLDGLLEEWTAAGACAVVLDPRNGDVLAIASRPTLDPNAIGEHAPDAWRNRAITDVYEPGSTFKPFVLSRAIDLGLVRTDETLYCENGLYRMGGRLLHDHHPFGQLSLIDVIVRSSNIGMAKIGQRLGNENMYNAVVDFGFGRPTGIELPGEVRGKVRPLGQWTSYSTGSVPMGHEIGVTPLQLVTAYAAVANGGRLLRPRLTRPDATATPWLAIEKVSGSDSTAEESTPEAVAHPVREETAGWMLDPVLKNVVESDRGTGRRARIEGYTVFGKSGTAQKAVQGHYSHRKHISSFLVGGPLPEPRVLVLVMVDDPHGKGPPYGGLVAGPTAAKILERTLHYLHVPTDEERAAVAAESAAPSSSDEASSSTYRPAHLEIPEPLE